MSFTIVSIYDNTRWDKFVRNAHLFDFNHTWHYHSTCYGDPVLLVYEERDDYIALPLVKITSADGNKVLKGFAGPVSNRSFELLDNGIQVRFEEEILSWLKEQQISSSAIQLHPLIHSSFKPLRMGNLYAHSDSLLIDLSQPAEVQQQRFGENFDNNTQLLRRKGYTVRPAVAIQDVDTFSEIFQRNSRHLRSSSAFFDKAWFRQILRPTGFETSLLLACQGTEITAGVLLTFCNGVMQLHLAATHEHYLAAAPLQLLLAEASILGKNMGMQYFHLGGMAGKPDALFASKAIMPDTYPGFRSWQIVQHQTINTIKSKGYTQRYSVAV